MNVLKPGEVLIDRVADYRSGYGDSGVDDAYDMYLARQRTGDYLLIVFMKLQFFFRDGYDSNLNWTDNEKIQFVSGWQQAVQNTWGGRTLRQLSNRKRVQLDFRFDIKVGGWMFDHWEITVRKVKKSRVSSVTQGRGVVELDSRDLPPAPKNRDRRTGQLHMQRAVVHEFGHMLGLDDEYENTSPHKNDYPSIMHSGETIYPRHDAVYMGWLSERLAARRIA
jgi:hypothetical protein